MLVYAMYDEVHDRLNKRRKAIARQFPNVVSKLGNCRAMALRLSLIHI